MRTHPDQTLLNLLDLDVQRKALQRRFIREDGRAKAGCGSFTAAQEYYNRARRADIAYHEALDAAFEVAENAPTMDRLD